MSRYVYDKHNTTWNVLCTVFTHEMLNIRNLTRSLPSLVRFLIRQQLVRKYRTPALSMKYSLYTPYVLDRPDLNPELQMASPK